VELYAVHSRENILSKTHSPHKLLVEQKTLKSMDQESIIKMIGPCDNKSERTLGKTFAEVDIGMIFVSATSRESMELGVLMAKSAKEKGVFTIAFITSPNYAQGKLHVDYQQDEPRGFYKAIDVIFPIATGEAGVGSIRTFICTLVDIVCKVGIVNMDLDDFYMAIGSNRLATLGIGSGQGEKCFQIALEQAVDSLIIERNLGEAIGGLMYMVGNRDSTIEELEEIAQDFNNRLDPSANIIFGAYVDQRLEHQAEVTIIPTWENGCK